MRLTGIAFQGAGFARMPRSLGDPKPGPPSPSFAWLRLFTMPSGTRRQWLRGATTAATSTWHARKVRVAKVLKWGGGSRAARRGRAPPCRAPSSSAADDAGQRRCGRPSAPCRARSPGDHAKRKFVLVARDRRHPARPWRAPAYLEIDKLPDGRYWASVRMLFAFRMICVLQD